MTEQYQYPPPPQQQYPPQQPAQPAPTAQPGPKPSGIHGLFVRRMIFLGMAIGALLMFVWAAIFIYSTDVDILKIGQLFGSLGAAIVFVSSIGGGMVTPEFSNWQRLGLFIVAFAAVGMI